MRKLKFDIIFWDSINPKTIEHISIEEAYSENYIEFKNNTIIPTDECTIVRQFTGLKDKNGKEIYEGDVMESEINGIGVVQWDNDNSTFHVFVKDNADDDQFFFVKEYGGVIGNVHENPELIKN